MAARWWRSGDTLAEDGRSSTGFVPDAPGILRSMARFDPTRPDFAPYGLTCTPWTPTLTGKSDRHNEIELNLMLGSSIAYLLAGRRVTLQPGRLHAFWAAVPHQIIDMGDGSDYLAATIPLAWFLRCDLPAGFVRSLLQGHLLCDNQQATAFDQQLFTRWIADLDGRPGERVRIVLLEMEARLRRMALGLSRVAVAAPRRGRLQQRGGAGGWQRAEALVAYFARHYTAPVSVAAVARAAGLHPHYAMTLFRSTIGETIVDYIVQQRIAHAQRLLVTGTEGILQVALAAGFGSLSRFNEAFKRSCGCTPRDYRRQMVGMRPET